jgi:hypothetical protein
MNIDKFIEAAVEFNVGKSHVKFKVIHNLSGTFGMNFDGALNAWLARTKNYTANSLCHYIKSKDESFIAMTEAQYQKLLKLGT